MFDLVREGVRLGSMTPMATGFIVRDGTGSPLGQVANLAAAIALLMRARVL